MEEQTEKAPQNKIDACRKAFGKSLLESLTDVLEWIEKQSAPNSQRAYHRCSVCDTAWWNEKEQHSLSCPVPRWKATKQAGVIDTTLCAPSRTAG
jgi:hypothetical protein